MVGGGNAISVPPLPPGNDRAALVNLPAPPVAGDDTAMFLSPEVAKMLQDKKKNEPTEFADTSEADLLDLLKAYCVEYAATQQLPLQEALDIVLQDEYQKLAGLQEEEPKHKHGRSKRSSSPETKEEERMQAFRPRPSSKSSRESATARARNKGRQEKLNDARNITKPSEPPAHATMSQSRNLSSLQQQVQQEQAAAASGEESDTMVDDLIDDLQSHIEDGQEMLNGQQLEDHY
jgi:hypothetical protein